MKKNFWSKSMKDYTGKDMIKWIAVFYAVFIAFYAVIYGIFIFWDQITSWIDDKVNFIKKCKIFKNKKWENCEEDEELE